MIPIRSLSTPRTPSWIVLQLLEQCNLRCKMCYEWGESGAYHDRGKMMRLDEASVRRLIESVASGRPHFEFFGGEPLLYEGIWRLVKLIRSHGSVVAFPTNGTLLSDQAEALVDAAPNRVMVSIDGTQVVNDRQRGQGVYQRALTGIGDVAQLKRRHGAQFPELGVNCVLTPDNYRDVETLFRDALPLDALSLVSIELQSYATSAQLAAYSALVKREFGISKTPCAQAYLRDPVVFDAIDRIELSRQMVAVRNLCASRGVRFYSQPASLGVVDLDHYLSGRWHLMSDRRTRCAMPWAHAEISARGEVTTCHSFYDVSIGNIYQNELLEIWSNEAAQRFRSVLREGLLPICTSCCRYYHASTG